MEKRDRHTIDLIARAVVSGRRGHGRKLDAVADSIAELMKNRLQACHATGAVRACRARRASAALPSRAGFKSLLNRIEKHLASLLLAESANDRSQPR